VKLYLDENISPRVARKLRARGFDVLSASEVGNTRLDDWAQFRYAVREGRAIVTGDIADFVEVAAAAVAANTPPAGIILVPSSFRSDEFDAIADGVEHVARQYPDGLPGTVVYLSRDPR
jgi:predicted nuclease of predicted toxin-antitoxin system